MRSPTASHPFGRWLGLSGMVLLAQGCASGASDGGPDRGPERALVSTAVGRVMLESRPHENVSWEWISASADRTYEALAEAYELLEIPPDTEEPDRMMYGASSHRASGSLAGVRMDRLFECGRAGGLGGDLASSRPLEISVVSRVRRTGPEGAEILTEATARVRGGDIARVHRSNCSSTGVLEAAIAKLVQGLVDAS